MTIGMSPSRANTFLNSEYAAVYVQLHTGDPGLAGNAHISAGDATRKQATMTTAANGSKALVSASGAWTNGGVAEYITHATLWTAASGGTFLRSVAAPFVRFWNTGDTLTLSSLAITLTPLAA